MRQVVSWLAWPALLGGSLLATGFGAAHDQPLLAFYVTYPLLAAALLLLERWMPHEAAWSPGDGQGLTDVMHTLASNATIQILLVFSAAIGFSALATADGPPGGIWPHTWPMTAQIVLGLVASEFALYWAHRIAHQWQPLWYFHAIHHSPVKLWVINSGRFHCVDAIKSVLPGLALLVAMGAPMPVLTWLSAIGAYVGVLAHCNVAMRFGVLSRLFNTPELHRWHHSRDLAEGNMNYGENIMVWDWVFGTWFNAARRPPADIGIADPMPPRFRDQVAWPFRALASRTRS